MIPKISQASSQSHHIKIKIANNIQTNKEISPFKKNLKNNLREVPLLVKTKRKNTKFLKHQEEMKG